MQYIYVYTYTSQSKQSTSPDAVAIRYDMHLYNPIMTTIEILIACTLP